MNAFKNLHKRKEVMSVLTELDGTMKNILSSRHYLVDEY